MTGKAKPGKVKTSSLTTARKLAFAPSSPLVQKHVNACMYNNGCREDKWNCLGAVRALLSAAAHSSLPQNERN